MGSGVLVMTALEVYDQWCASHGRVRGVIVSGVLVMTGLEV
jgi:hypothetical protein